MKRNDCAQKKITLKSILSRILHIVFYLHKEDSDTDSLLFLSLFKRCWL